MVPPDGRQVDRQSMLSVIANLIEAPADWAPLAEALAAGAAGNCGGLLALADLVNQRQPDGTYGLDKLRWTAIICLDDAFPRDPDAFFALSEEVAAVAPRTGDYPFQQILPCLFWPAPVTRSPTPARNRSEEPILVITTTLDPLDPDRVGARARRPARQRCAAAARRQRAHLLRQPVHRCHRDGLLLGRAAALSVHYLSLARDDLDDHALTSAGFVWQKWPRGRPAKRRLSGVADVPQSFVILRKSPLLREH